MGKFFSDEVERALQYITMTTGCGSAGGRRASTSW